MRNHILILGGTAEARQLASRLAERGDADVTLSLAGRTREPATQPVPVRVGGFGGPAGLADYLRAERVALLIDATHPYASQISRNAAEAARQAGMPILALRRSPWLQVEGDRWTEVGSVAEAVTALGPAPRRVFLALGRQEVAPFEAAPQHQYLVRSVDPIEPVRRPDIGDVGDRRPKKLDSRKRRDLRVLQRRRTGVDIKVAEEPGDGMGCEASGPPMSTGGLARSVEER